MAKHYLPFSRNIVEIVHTLTSGNFRYRHQLFGLADFYFVLDPKTTLLASRSGTVLIAREDQEILRKTTDELLIHETNLVRITMLSSIIFGDNNIKDDNFYKIPEAIS